MDTSAISLASYLSAKSAKHDAYDIAAIIAAQEIAREGELEVDDTTTTSRGDDEYGCYVLAWLWVPRDEMDLDESKLQTEDKAE